MAQLLTDALDEELREEAEAERDRRAPFAVSAYDDPTADAALAHIEEVCVHECYYCPRTFDSERVRDIHRWLAHQVPAPGRTQAS